MKMFKWILWYWKNRKVIGNLKNELQSLDNTVRSAWEDRKITKAETKEILREVDKVLQATIKMLEQ